jgi:hypothetical protein
MVEVIKMKCTKTILLLAAGLIFLSDYADGQGKKTGLEGFVFRISGNRMPSPDVKPIPPKGIKSTVYIYQLTSLSQVTRFEQSAFYSSIRTKFVQAVISDSTGYFFAILPPGEYSLFTKKDALFYANNFDGENHITPVRVSAGKMTQVNVNIDYDAVY